MYLSTHLTHWQTKCCNNGLVLVINLLLCHNVAKYCSFKHEKSQTIVCNDLKVMSFQTSKMDQILCMKKYLLQIQSLIMITEVHMQHSSAADVLRKKGICAIICNVRIVTNRIVCAVSRIV